MNKLKSDNNDQCFLYYLIWKQFISCQMLPAEYLLTNITVQANNFELLLNSSIKTFDGYTKLVCKKENKNNSNSIDTDTLTEGTNLTLIKLYKTKHFTKSPARYSESSLVRELEKKGIGRPSTYASITSTITDRGYVSIYKKQFYSNKIGDLVTNRLNEHFSNLMDYRFTAYIEKELDNVAKGKLSWKNLLNKFYFDFKTQCCIASDGITPNTPTLTNINCNKCKRNMIIRTASTGVFLACSGYKEDIMCKYTITLILEYEKTNTFKKKCFLCKNNMYTYFLNSNTTSTYKIHICSNNPDCKGYTLERKDSTLVEIQEENKKNTKNKTHIESILMPELKCNKVNDFYILKHGKLGLFLSSSNFPKTKDTRAPLVKEILPHKSELNKKYNYLCNAPIKDPDGIYTVIRFNNKTKEQYIQSEINGKPTGWRAFFNVNGNKWIIEDKRNNM